MDALLKKSKRNYLLLSSKSNQGTVKNYNNAISNSKGDIIIPLSQDDRFYSDNSVQNIVDFFEQTECIICQGKQIGDKSRNVYPSPYDELFFEKSSFDCWIRMLHSNFVSGSALYFKRDIINNFGMFDERFCLLEDRPFITNIFEKNERVLLMDQVTIVYGENGVSSKEPSPKMAADYYLLYTDLLKQITKMKLPHIAFSVVKSRLRYYKRLSLGKPKSFLCYLEKIKRVKDKMVAKYMGKDLKEYEIDKLISSCRRKS